MEFILTSHCFNFLFISDALDFSLDGITELRNGGDGYNLTTAKDLVPGNQDNLKGSTNTPVKSVNMDEFTSLSRAAPPGTNLAKEGFDLLKSLIQGMDYLISNPSVDNLNEGDTVKVRKTTPGGGSYFMPLTREEGEIKTIKGMTQDKTSEYDTYE